MSVLAVASLSGCTADGDTAQVPDAVTEADVGDVEVPPTARDSREPIEAAAPSDAAGPSSAASTAVALEPLPLVPLFQEVTTEDETVFRAIERLVQACMADKGFDYVPAEPPPDLQFDVTDGVATMMESLVPGERHDERSDGGEGLQRANPAWTALESGDQRQAWERAYDGTVVGQRAREGGVTVDFPDGSGELPGGCFGQAQDAAVPDRVAARLLEDEFERVYNSALERVKAHPAVQQVTEEWSRCLAERGFDYARPGDAREEAHDRDDPLGRAVGDCAVEVDWARRVNPVEVEVQVQIIAENEGLIASLADQREAARQRARELLGEG